MPTGLVFRGSLAKCHWGGQGEEVLLPLSAGQRGLHPPHRVAKGAFAHLNPGGDQVLTQSLQQLDLGAPLATAKPEEGGIAL